MINKQIIEEYAKIKSEIKLLEEKADALNPQILEMMQTEEVGEIDLEVGKIIIKSRNKWKYTQETEDMEKKLKEKQTLEQQLGTASYVKNEYIQFNPIKNKENEL